MEREDDFAPQRLLEGDGSCSLMLTEFGRRGATFEEPGHFPCGWAGEWPKGRPRVY